MAACDMVIVSNPHNPTGQVIQRRDLTDVALRHPASILVVDESYMDFLADEAAQTLVGCGADNVIVLRSPSKFWGLAGVRSGAAWSRQPLRAQWDRWRTSWPVSAFAAAALRTALAGKPWASEIRQVLAADAAWLEGCLTQAGLDIAPGRLHFRLLTGPGPDVDRLAGRLDSCGIAARVLEAAYGTGRPAIRISAPRRQDRRQLAAALEGPRAGRGPAARRGRADPPGRPGRLAGRPSAPRAGRGHRSMSSTYDVRIWDPRKIGDTAKGRWRVRWVVAGKEKGRSFAVKPLADGFAADLRQAVRDGTPFDEATGLPVTPATPVQVTWYDHARSYTDMKWPQLAPTSRRSVAEALTTITPALTRHHRGAPDPKVLSRALFAWAFNPGTRNLTPPGDITSALGWIAAASVNVADLDDPAVIRAALGACAVTLSGTPAAATTQRRKRSVLYNALGYAIELGLLTANPVDRIQWKTPGVAATIDRRVVFGPALARKLLDGVRAQGPRGEHLEAFFGCLYYAATRPSEALMLTEPDLRLPSRGWGRIDLTASAARAGRDWTDDGTSRQARGLKHRARNETRSVPIPPVLVEMLRSHLRAWGTAPDGRLFRTSRGGLIQDSAYSAVWQGARAAALNPRPARIAPRPAPLRRPPRRCIPLAQLRRPRHRGRPPRRALRRRPPNGLRPLHRRPGRRRQQAHRRRPRR
jgi:Aminotransferase class I and II